MGNVKLSANRGEISCFYFYYYYYYFRPSPIRKSDAIYIHQRFWGEGRGDEKLHGCQDVTSSGRVERNDHGGRICSGRSGYTGTFLRQTVCYLNNCQPPSSNPPPQYAWLKLWGWGFFWLRKLAGLFLFVMYVFVAHTPWNV